MIFKCFEFHPFSGIVFKTFASVFFMFASYFRRTWFESTPFEGAFAKLRFETDRMVIELVTNTEQTS